MKKTLAVCFTALLALSTVSAQDISKEQNTTEQNTTEQNTTEQNAADQNTAEQNSAEGLSLEQLTFDQLEGLEWTFSSGAGGWSTDMRILSDGSFSGEFHDSEMGEMGESYPDGTIYCCSFTGQMSIGNQIDEFSREIRIESLTLDESQEKESIEDGIRFVASEPYGISADDTMRLYLPGTPVSELTEDMKMWAHLLTMEEAPSEMENWFLYSEKNESGFVGYQNAYETGLANPWTDLTEEELQQVSGVVFGVPEGAENVIYRWMAADSLAEMQFTIGSDEYCARIQPADLKQGELMNISGMYLYWENEEPVTIGHCDGTVAVSQTGSEDWAELCMWYDLVPGLMYSLSAYTTDPDGLDLTAVAQQVYVPMQGNN